MKPIAFLLRHRNLLLLLVALGLGALAAFGARGYLSEQIAIERERLAPQQPMAQVVVAKRPLVRGDTVSADTMALREMPQAFLPAGVVTPEQFEALVGASLLQPMQAGAPLQRLAIALPEGGIFSARLRSGVRALTIGVDEVNSLSGMLQPGDRIDLMLSVRLPGAGVPVPQELTRTLMQDVRVLATGRQVSPDQEERQPGRAYTAITIEVSPEQAQQLVVAQRSGKLTAMLRNPGDRDPVGEQVLDVYGLLGISPVPAPVAAAAPAELIVGGQGPLRQQDRLAQALAQAFAGGTGAAAGLPAVQGATGASPASPVPLSGAVIGYPQPAPGLGSIPSSPAPVVAVPAMR